MQLNLSFGPTLWHSDTNVSCICSYVYLTSASCSVVWPPAFNVHFGAPPNDMDNIKWLTFLHGRSLPSGSLISVIFSHGISMSQWILQSSRTELSGQLDGVSASLVWRVNVTVLSFGPANLWKKWWMTGSLSWTDSPW